MSKRPVEKIHKSDWRDLQPIMPHMNKHKISLGISWDQENIDYINKVRGQTQFGPYVNGIITAIRQYHEEKKK